MLKVINTDINSQNLNKWVPFVYIVYISTISSRRGLLSKLIKLILRLILEHSKPFLVHSLVTFSSAWVTFLALLVVWMGKSHTWLWFSFPLSNWFSAFTFWLFLSLFLVSNFGPLLFCHLFVCLYFAVFTLVDCIITGQTVTDGPSLLFPPDFPNHILSPLLPPLIFSSN